MAIKLSRRFVDMSKHLAGQHGVVTRAVRSVSRYAAGTFVRGCVRGPSTAHKQPQLASADVTRGVGLPSKHSQEERGEAACQTFAPHFGLAQRFLRPGIGQHAQLIAPCCDATSAANF